MDALNLNSKESGLFLPFVGHGSQCLSPHLAAKPVHSHSCLSCLPAGLLQCTLCGVTPEEH